MSEHTDWKVVEICDEIVVWDSKSRDIICNLTVNTPLTYKPTAMKRAEYIVRACNAYLKITRLLKAAKCPCCDGSGGFYDNHGNACQCQWCDETKAAIAKAGE